jgi:hypothetical protein
MFDLKGVFSAYLAARGLDGVREDPQYPRGITTRKFSKLLKKRVSAMLVLPADVVDAVSDSETVDRIKEDGDDLSGKYVIYRGFRRGCGHESDYG